MPASLRLVSPGSVAEWTEPDIKQLAESNPREAMEILIRKHREALYFHALYIVKDQAEAYDVVQEVYIRAMREHRLFNPDFKMKAWLYRVTSNLCFNMLRNKKRRGAILDTMHRPEPLGADQIEQVFADQQRSEVMASLDEVSEAHKEILLLRYYDDLSYAEIADVLQIKLGTVMSRLSRARMRLLEVMETEEAVH